MNIVITQEDSKIIALPKRECGDCTVCCNGTLKIEVHGHGVHAGKPCFYMKQGGCSIYEQRPEVCRKYECEWVSSDYLPEWMKPNISNVLVTRRVIDGVEFFELLEAGKTLDITAFNWMLQWALANEKNILYTINGMANGIGSQEFLSIMKKIESKDENRSAI
jgi:hypothetical protein